MAIAGLLPYHNYMYVIVCTQTLLTFIFRGMQVVITDYMHGPVNLPVAKALNTLTWIGTVNSTPYRATCACNVLPIIYIIAHMLCISLTLRLPVLVTSDA